MEKRKDDGGKKLTYDEVEALAKQAAKEAMAACPNLHEGLPAYMNTYHRVISEHGFDVIYD